LDINPDDPHVLESFAFLLSKQPSNFARAEQISGGICDVHSASDKVSPFENRPYNSF
jgi:hypothetical protein